MDKEIILRLNTFIKRYLDMDIFGVKINCPYWMNRIKERKVALRGFADGKGSSEEIQKELIKRLNNSPPSLRFDLSPESLRKFAKRNRIGIDCSGFVYRVLDELIRLRYKNIKIRNLSELFIGGINRTNAKTLTDPKYCHKIDKVPNFQPGDLIRLWGGRHIAIILEVKPDEIIYCHSSHLSTKIQGVHLNSIKIFDIDKPLDQQNWIEETKKGENFGGKYFHPKVGDGVFRMKIFDDK